MRVAGITVCLLCSICVVFTAPALACRDDFDCDSGSECKKESQFAWEGICVGGRRPDNRHDKKPPTNPMNPRTYGDTCFHNGQCGLGLTCVKEPGRTEGICLQAR